MSQTLSDLSQIKESIKLITNALNKAAKSGTFTIDESYVIKISLNNIEKFTEMYESQLQPKHQLASKQQPASNYEKNEIIDDQIQYIGR